MEKLESMEDEVEAIEEKEDELEEMEDELEERRESILQKIMVSLRLAKKKHNHELEEEFEEQEEQVHELEEDVKEVLKIAHSWLEKLPPRHKKEFKTSKDFEKYKSILEKYGLVKPKTETKTK
jgi:predicted RNase H-like nuclease (RuvC/YqgF family)